jgi:hypothetical protein
MHGHKGSKVIHKPLNKSLGGYTDGQQGDIISPFLYLYFIQIRKVG